MSAENQDTFFTDTENQDPVHAGRMPVNEGKQDAEVLSRDKITELIRTAQSMLLRSYIPYSGFAVGAALLCADGRVYTGCNIENAAFGPSVCAERTAFFKAVSEGERDFAAIAVVGGRDRQPDSLCPPCGVCRQVMREFCSPQAFRIIMAQDTDHYLVRTLAELLPDSFGPEQVTDAQDAAPI